MDESRVSIHTFETKQHSKQWLEKGLPGPVKAKVCATMMVLASFDSQGIGYYHYVPKGKTVN
jgi:hypothetical protein